MRPLVLSLVVLIACNEREKAPDPPLFDGFLVTADAGLQGDVLAVATGPQGQAFAATLGPEPTDPPRLWSSSDDGLTWTVSSRPLPGVVRWLGVLPGGTVLAWVDDRGLMRRPGDGGDWVEAGALPRPALLDQLSERYRPVPFDLHPGAGVGEGWVAAAGVLARTVDDGETFEAVPIPPTAGTNLLFTGVGGRGEELVATAVIPTALVPDRFAGLLSGTVFRSDDAGITWTDADPEGRFTQVMDACVDEDGERLVIATMDQGVWWHREVSGWVAMGGPPDVVQVACDGEGLIRAASATTGLWWHDGETLRSTSPGGSDRLDPLAGLAGAVGVYADGRVAVPAEGQGSEVPQPGGATVHVALSQHVNLYHSYRGDSPTDDGYGLDLAVIGRTLDWLDAHPDVHADWDIDNHFSLDGWFVTDPDAAELLDRLRPRITAGTDGLRLMSWNNGAVAHHPREAFDEAIGRAQDSYDAAFGPGTWDRGVQPQENMYTPEHLGWYADLGVEWITLFHSATPFGALQAELGALPPEAWYRPFTLTDPEGTESMTAVPTYHHGDLLDHGGLAGWARQIHQAFDGDRLLVIHFDADAESWENFDAALTELETLDFVESTTIQDFLDAHPVSEVEVSPYDMADGAGDGLSSWAEKDVNADVFTDLVVSRDLAAVASVLAPDDPTVAEHVDAAFEARLVGLSTTHFGLAVPRLHPDREDAARGLGAQARSAAADALDAVPPPADGTIQITPPGEGRGAAWVQTELVVPDAAWQGTEAVQIRDPQGLPLPRAVLSTRTDPSPDGILPGPIVVTVGLGVPVDGPGPTTLTWSADGTTAPPLGEVAAAPTLADMPLGVPRTTCAGVTTLGTQTGTDTEVDPDGLFAHTTITWDLGLCDAPGTLTWTLSRVDGVPGVAVAATWALGEGDTEEAESVEPLPVRHPEDAPILDRIRWRTFGGRMAQRRVLRHRGAWNGQAIDGHLELSWDDGTAWTVVVDTSVRTNMGLAPMRTQVGSPDRVALLGALWADPPRHRSRAMGGHGLGDVGTAAIGSQFRPSAPDWADQTHEMSVWFAPRGAMDDDQATVLAHPPVVRVGDWTDAARR